MTNRALDSLSGRDMGGHLAGTYGICGRSVQEQLLVADEWPSRAV